MTRRLYPYQVVGAKWLTSQRAAALFDEMGVGKTPQGIAAIPRNAPVAPTRAVSRPR